MYTWKCLRQKFYAMSFVIIQSEKKWVVYFIIYLRTYIKKKKRKQQMYTKEWNLSRRRKKPTMLDQKPIYKINEYHIKMAWEKKKQEPSEWKAATTTTATASTTRLLFMFMRCSSIYRHACYVRCRPIFMHSVVILHKKGTTPWSQTMMCDQVFLSFFCFVLSHASYQFFKCVDVDDADNRVIESTPIILFGLDLEHTSAHLVISLVH